MAKIINPFIVTGKIAPEYFCDRVSESARLVKSVTNGNNLVVISPRTYWYSTWDDLVKL